MHERKLRGSGGENSQKLFFIIICFEKILNFWHFKKGRGYNLRREMRRKTLKGKFVPLVKKNMIYRCEQGSNLRGKIPLDFKSNALTTRPSQPRRKYALLLGYKRIVQYLNRRSLEIGISGLGLAPWSSLTVVWSSLWSSPFVGLCLFLPVADVDCFCANQRKIQFLLLQSFELALL